MTSLKQIEYDFNYTSNILSKGVMLEEDSIKDKDWLLLPYIYTNIICSQCNKKTKYVKRMWVGLFDFHDIDSRGLYCDKCCKQEK